MAQFRIAMIRKEFSLMPLLFGWILAVAVSGCMNGSEQGSSDISVRINLDKGDEGRLLAYYLGSYLGSEPTDPVSAGLIQERGKSWFLLPPAGVQSADSSLQVLFEEGSEKGEIDWDLFEAFILDTYYDVRSVPATLTELTDQTGNWRGDKSWFSITVQGSMSPYLRRVSVKRSALDTALDSLNSVKDAILYPLGTVFIGEHLDVFDQVVETTVMRKRVDGYWDYFAYDADGQLASEIEKDPENMNVPTRCTGCHLGNRQFEPEKSYPVTPAPGPRGERRIHVSESTRNAGVTTALREHSRRSDTILGLYATVYLGTLVADRESGTLSKSQIELLDKLELGR